MRSSKRIIRGQQAAELPSWSVEIIGSHYENAVERMLAEVDHLEHPGSRPPLPLSEREQALQNREQAMKQREIQLKQLEQETLSKAQEEGRQAGYEAGWHAASDERQALLHATQTIEHEFEQFKTELADKLLDLAVMVSKKVVADTVELNTEHAKALLEQVLESMNLHGKAITLKAHPDTCALLKTHYEQDHSVGNIRLVQDTKQIKGGFVLQHTEGEVDCTLETRWQKAIEALGRSTPLATDETKAPEAAPHHG